jgi:hypothetical protein
MRRYYRHKDINIISNSNDSRVETSEKPNKDNSKKVKFDFKNSKNNTMRSLNEVESFLRDLKGLSKYIKLYYLFK